MTPVQAFAFNKEIMFFCKYNESRALSFLKFCAELRNRIIIHQGFQFKVLDEGKRINKNDLVINHLYLIKNLKAFSPGGADEHTFNQDGLFNLIFHLILGWHRQLEEWTKIEKDTVENVFKKLKKETQYYEALTTMPIRDADPRDYIIKRSGWILPGHFGAKSGG